MGLNLGIRTQAFTLPEDQSWLKSKHGTQEMYPGTLDQSLFLNAQFPNGLVPSGTILAKITAGGLYAPYLEGQATGQEVPIGVLFTTVDLTGGQLGQANANVPASILWHGALIAAKLPKQSGAGSLQTMLAAASTVIGATNFRARFHIV